VVVALAVVVVAAAGVPEGSVRSTPRTSTSSPFPKEVLIGAVYPLTGSQAPSGVDLKNGIDLAVELINRGQAAFNLPLVQDGGGLANLGGAKLRILYGDSQADPQKGQSETERLVTSEKVTAMLGAYHSAVTATASQAAERLGVPFLSPEATSPTLVTRGFRWFFRSTPDDSTFAENFFQFLDDAARNFPGQVARTLAILHTDDLFGSDVSRFSRQFAEQYGYEVVTDAAYKANTPDLTSEVQRLKASGAGILIAASYLPDATLAVKGMKQQGVTFQGILGMDAGFVDTKLIPNLGRDTEGLLTREVWAKDLGAKKPLVKQVNDLFRSRYGTHMNGQSARAFTGVFVLADAINRAASLEPARIQAALRTTDIKGEQLVMPWDGVAFDARGQNTKGRGIMVQIQHGEYVTVWPLELASKDLVWPLPAWSKRPADTPGAWDVLAQSVTSGILLGLILALSAAGLTLIWGVMDVVNFAHGDFLMLGMYGTFFAWSLFGLDPLLALPGVVVALAAIGVAVYATVIRPVLRANVLAQMFATFGLGILLRGLAQYFFSPAFRQVGQTASSGVVALGPVSVGREQVVAAGGALIVSLLLFAILDRTTLGTALRATAEDRVAAELMGIDSGRMFALAWALGAGCVGAAGALLALYFPVFPDVGAMFGLLAFVTVALGGFGSVAGALLAGVLIGVVVNLAGVFVDPSYKFALAYALCFAVLFLRPQGLLGRA
jgi:branched-chain amino acid transport system substrate-binding protein